MNNIKLFMISVVGFGLVLFSTNTYSQSISTEKDKESIGVNASMSFNIALDRTKFYRLEPIEIKCRFSNETNQSQTTLIPSFLSESRIEVNFEGESKQYNTISIFRILLRREPVTLESGKGFEEDITLETRLGEFFPESGIYRIRLLLNGSSGKLIRSNQVELRIMEPTGIDKEAFDFIKQNKVHERHPMLAIWNDDLKLENGHTLLEEFVSRYSGSIYGEYAIYQLGNYYYAKRAYEKAKVELVKLRNSKNPRIATDAKSRLTDVEKYCPTILPKDSNQR